MRNICKGRVGIRLSVLVSLSLFIQVTAMAETDQPIEEVFQSELVYPQEKGEVQLTSFPRFSRGELQDISMIPLALEYGLTDAWQFEVEWNSFVTVDNQFSKAARGIGDLGLGMKYSFMNIKKSGFHAAIAAEVELPTGDEEKGLGAGETTYGGSVIFAHDLKGSGVQFFAQFGTEIEESASEPFWHTGFFLPSSLFTLTTEYSWTEESSYLTPGLIFSFPGNFQMGVGIPIGLTEDSDDYQIIGLVTYEFSLMGDHDGD